MSAETVVRAMREANATGTSAFFANELAESLRAVLHTPMSDPTHRDVVIRARALLITWDEDERT